MTVGVVVEAWLTGREARREIRATTAKSYRHSLGRFVDYVGPDTPVGEITAETFEHWLASLHQLSPASLNTAAAPVRAFFAYAAERGMITANPTVTVGRSRSDTTKPRRLPPDTIARLLHVADFRERTIIMLGLHLGMRAGEMSRANIGDWDRHAATIHVRGKGGKDRVLPIGGEIEFVLAMWCGERRAGPLFPSQHAERIGPGRVSQIFTAVARRARVDATHHQLRHTCAADLLASGLSPPAVQRFLGHSSLATTSIYLAAGDAELLAATGRSYGLASP